MVIIKGYMLLATIVVWYKLQKKSDVLGIYFLPVPFLLGLFFLEAI
ncbi:hypothetical protein KUA25_04440 [Bacteroidales bacterium MSK.15.36]|nr:hypothetical protein [Bacteroidales bacterium MSK.15.36]